MKDRAPKGAGLAALHFYQLGAAPSMGRGPQLDGPEGGARAAGDGPNRGAGPPGHACRIRKPG